GRADVHQIGPEPAIVIAAVVNLPDGPGEQRARKAPIRREHLPLDSRQQPVRIGAAGSVRKLHYWMRVRSRCNDWPGSSTRDAVGNARTSHARGVAITCEKE